MAPSSPDSEVSLRPNALGPDSSHRAVLSMQRQGRGVDPDLFAPLGKAAVGTPSAANVSPFGSMGRSYPAPPLDYAADSNQAEMGAAPFATVELEHMSGFTGKHKGTVHAHPSDPDGFITCMGAAVVLGRVHESHGQELLRGHDEEINALSVSSSGGMLASAQLPSRRRPDAGAAIVVWDLAARRQVFSLEGFRRPVLQMAFSPDDHFLAASSDDCRVLLWDMRTSELVLSRAFPAPVTILNWGRVDEKLRRPKYALTLAHSSQLLLGELAFDIAGMQYKLELAPLAMPNVGLARSYLCAAVAAPSMELLAGTTAGELVVFSTEAMVYRDALPVSRNGVHSLAACRATGAVYVGAGDGVLKKLVGRGAEWSLAGQVQLVGGVTSLSVAPGGAQLLAGTAAGKTFLVRAATLEASELASSHLGAVSACAFGASSETVATISLDGSLRLWDLSTYSLRAMATEAAAGLSVAHVPAAAALLLTGWADGWVRAFDAQSARRAWHIANAHRGEVTSVAGSADGKLAVSGASDGGVSVWSLATRELVLQFHEHARAVSEVLADARRPHLVHSCGLDKALFIYDLRAERRVVAQQVRDGAFLGMAQRLDGDHEVVTAGADGRLLVWDCDAQEPVLALAEPRRTRLTCVRVSPSGRFLAAGSDDGELRVYDAARLARLAGSAASGHSAAVNQLAWSPDERQLVSVGADACVCVWNFYLDER